MKAVFRKKGFATKSNFAMDHDQAKLSQSPEKLLFQLSLLQLDDWPGCELLCKEIKSECVALLSRLNDLAPGLKEDTSRDPNVLNIVRRSILYIRDLQRTLRNEAVHAGNNSTAENRHCSTSVDST